MFLINKEKRIISALRDGYMSLGDTASRVPGGVTVTTVRSWIIHGVRGHRLRAVRAGTRYRILPEDLTKFLAQVANM